MKVVFLSTEAGLGGAERCLEDLALGLPSRDATWESHVVLLAEGPLADRLRRGGAGVTVLPLPREVSGWGEAASGALGDRMRALWSGGRASAPALRFATLLRQTLSDLRPDVVHTNGAKAHLLGAVAGVPNAKLLWHLHDYLGARGLSRLLLPLASRRVSLAVANSQAVADDASALLKNVAVEFVHNGVDLNYFRPGPHEGAWLDGIAKAAPADGVRVGLVATYARWKGHLVFLEAARRVADRLGPKARFYIVGGPIYRTKASQWSEEELKAEVRRLGLEAQVVFVPFQTDVARVYRGLDVVVHASTEPEPFGRAIVEAMSCGRAVIATALGGATEILTRPEEAVSVPSRDPAALAVSMERLITDDWTRKKMGEQARAGIVSRFSVQRYVDSFLEHYRRLAPARPAQKRLLGA